MPLYAKPPSREEGAVTLKWICKTSSGSSNLLPPASDKQTSEDKMITISKLPWKTPSADELSIGEHHSAHLGSKFCWHLLSLGLSLSNSSKSLQSFIPWWCLGRSCFSGLSYFTWRVFILPMLVIMSSPCDLAQQLHNTWKDCSKIHNPLPFLGKD